jgi:hypothetical protein
LNEKIKIKNEIQQSYELCCELKLRKQSLVEEKRKKVKGRGQGCLRHAQAWHAP